MRKVLSLVIALALAALAIQPASAKKKKPAAPKTTVKKVKVKKASAQPSRKGQTSPAPDRYRQIQEALAAKGYLPAEQASGQWNDASADALKRFQADQNLDATGKVNSLSLIALGLGPKHDATPTVVAPATTPANPQ
jgi:peptidoglycan hydrolase-like protein with peptidoglycan-binding domain